jgi:hypothetical protein
MICEHIIFIVLKTLRINRMTAGRLISSFRGAEVQHITEEAKIRASAAQSLGQILY